MTEDGIRAKEEAMSQGAVSGISPRMAVLDRDSGFIQVLSKRLDRLGWEHRVLASPVPTDAIAAMRLSALVVDLAVLGPPAWEWLERLCGSAAGAGRRRVHRPVDRRTAGARPAPRAPMTGSPSPVIPRR